MSSYTTDPRPRDRVESCHNMQPPNNMQFGKTETNKFKMKKQSFSAKQTKQKSHKKVPDFVKIKVIKNGHSFSKKMKVESPETFKGGYQT